MDNYKLLDWDTNFFGFPVARITEEEITKQQATDLFATFQEQGIILVYWSFNAEKDELDSIAQKHHGFLTGIKIHYLLNLDEKQQYSIDPSSDMLLRKYKEKKPTSDLFDLIIQGGIYSRFYTDPRIGKQRYRNLHKNWITNSVKDHTLYVLEKNENIIGFISLNECNQNANIDFIVVDENYRGHGLGKLLMNQAHNWAVNNNYTRIQADTQKENVKACSMYESFGYQPGKEEKFYHFWLTQDK